MKELIEGWTFRQADQSDAERLPVKAVPTKCEFHLVFTSSEAN